VTSAEGVLSALGGIAAFAGLMWVIMRAAASRIRAIDDNTDAIRELSGKLDRIAALAEGHETRISRLEGWRGRGGAR
jgi:hypothetical protein